MVIMMHMQSRKLYCVLITTLTNACLITALLDHLHWLPTNKSKCCQVKLDLHSCLYWKPTATVSCLTL